jgi:16S rRNA processing protein RimM
MKERIPEHLIILGKVVRAHGIRGAIKVRLDTDFPERLRTYPHLEWVRGEKRRRCRLRAVSVTGEFGIVQIEGCDDRDQAEQLVGGWLGVAQEQLPELDEDSWYWFELIGYEVRDREGTLVGRCVDLLRVPAHDLLVVRTTEDREVLIPFVTAIVPHVDRSRRTITVDPPLGMLDG